MTLTVLPLTPERLPDLDAVFQARGCAVARDCYCMYYRQTAKDHGGGHGAQAAARHRAEMAGLAAAGPPPGLIGYRGGEPVGWVALGPRQDFARLARSRTMRAVDDQPVWSIVCFVVPSAHRQTGVAHGLLAAAVDHARAQGARLLEAYPVDRGADPRADAAWFGSLSMFTRAGFDEVARHQPARPIVRLRVVRSTEGAVVRGDSP